MDPCDTCLKPCAILDLGYHFFRTLPKSGSKVNRSRMYFFVGLKYGFLGHLIPPRSHIGEVLEALGSNFY